MRQAQALALEQEVRERKEQVSTPPAAARRLEGFSKGGPGAISGSWATEWEVTREPDESRKLVFGLLCR